MNIGRVFVIAMVLGIFGFICYEIKFAIDTTAKQQEEENRKKITIFSECKRDDTYPFLSLCIDKVNNNLCYIYEGYKEAGISCLPMPTDPNAPRGGFSSEEDRADFE